MPYISHVNIPQVSMTTDKSMRVGHVQLNGTLSEAFMAKPHIDDLWQTSDLLKKKFHAKTPNTTQSTCALYRQCKTPARTPNHNDKSD